CIVAIIVATARLVEYRLAVLHGRRPSAFAPSCQLNGDSQSDDPH
ncbi:MAG: hypothetical protein ACI9Y1_003439, partial [Lentisphaeria bacterium]